MRRYFPMVFFLALLASSLTMSLIPGAALGQSMQVPRLEGVSYFELAEWQWRYGGGYYGMPLPPGGYCRFGPGDRQEEQEVQPPPAPKKRSARKGTKKRSTEQ